MSSRIFKSVLTLVMGAGLSKLIALAFIPVITRIYEPADLGILSVYTSFVFIIAPLLCLRYCLAIPLENDKDNQITLFWLCVTCVLITSVILIVAIIALMQIQTYYKTESSFVLYVVIGSASLAVAEIFNIFSFKVNDYKRVSIIQVAQSLIGGTAKVTIAGLMTGGMALVYAQLLQSISLMLMSGAIRKNQFISTVSQLNIKNVIYISTKYIDFPKFRLPTQLFTVLASNIPIPIIAYCYSSTDAGLVSLAFMVILAPISMIGVSAGKALYSELAKTKGNVVEIKSEVISIFLKLFSIGILISLFLYIVGEDFFSIVFGDEWRLSGTYAFYLSIYMIFDLSIAPLLNIFSIIHKHKTYMFISILRCAATVSPLLWAYYEKVDLDIALILFSISVSIFFLFSLFVLLRNLSRS